jgi:hypothetical protein
MLARFLEQWAWASTRRRHGALPAGGGLAFCASPRIAHPTLEVGSDSDRVSAKQRSAGGPVAVMTPCTPRRPRAPIARIGNGWGSHCRADQAAGLEQVISLEDRAWARPPAGASLAHGRQAIPGAQHPSGDLLLEFASQQFVPRGGGGRAITHGVGTAPRSTAGWVGWRSGSPRPARCDASIGTGPRGTGSSQLAAPTLRYARCIPSTHCWSASSIAPITCSSLRPLRARTWKA